MEHFHFRLTEINFKNTDFAEIMQKLPFQNKEKSSTKFNFILKCGKHFLKGVLERNGRIKNVLEFDVEKYCEFINKDYPYK